MDSIWNILLLFLKEYPWTLVFYILFTLLAFPLESIVVPRLYSAFFNELNKFGQKTVDKNIFITFFTTLFIIIFIVNASNVATLYIESYLIPELFGFLYNFIFINLLLKNENSITEIEIGKIITRLLVVPETLKLFVINFCVWFLPRFLAIIVINIYFLYVNWKLGLCSLLLLFIYFVCIFYFFKMCINSSTDRHKNLELLNQYTHDKLSNTRSIYSSGTIENEKLNYEKHTNYYTEFYKKSLTCLKYNISFVSIFLVFLYIILHIFTAFLYWTGEINIFLLISIFITIIYYIPCLYSINSVIPEFINNLGIISSTEEFVSELYEQYQKEEIKKEKDKEKEQNPNELKNGETKNSEQLKNGEIIIQQLTFQYLPNNPPIFENFDLKIQDKQRVAIVGPSGNGKTTLIKLIMGYYKIPENMIWVGGNDVNNYTLNDLRQQITYVHQNAKLFNTSIIENIKYGNDASIEYINEIMNKYNLHVIFKNIQANDFLNFQVGVEGNNLSGGQRQMVMILRALLKQNKIVILDEPTSAIDGESKMHVIRAMKVLSENSTLIIITHDPDILNLVDRIVTIDSGKIVSDEMYLKNKNYSFV
jgi:ABC-type multidrug transport system fused ATPase/permease subunit